MEIKECVERLKDMKVTRNVNGEITYINQPVSFAISVLERLEREKMILIISEHHSLGKYFYI